jgi:hypothetical protein
MKTSLFVIAAAIVIILAAGNAAHATREHCTESQIYTTMTITCASTRCKTECKRRLRLSQPRYHISSQPRQHLRR